MSASMLKRLLEEASVFMSEEKYENALDSSRRVTQFDPNNFQAFICVGMASYQLEMWEDCEEAYQRAIALKPNLPVPWKNLIDLYEKQGNNAKKLNAIENIVAIFRKSKKIKPCQRWTNELGQTAMILRQYTKAFDSWYDLVRENGDEDISLVKEQNDELPHPVSIWLDLIELLQTPGFKLEDCKEEYSMITLAEQFCGAASRKTWEQDSVSTSNFERMDAGIAYIFRMLMNNIRKLSPGAEKKNLLKTIDTLANNISNWFPRARLPLEYLLLRSEDQDSSIDEATTEKVFTQLTTHHPKCGMCRIFIGIADANSPSPTLGTDYLLEAINMGASSPFQESTYFVSTYMTLAKVALEKKDVEEVRLRLQKARNASIKKLEWLSCEPPKQNVYSEATVKLMETLSMEFSGEVLSAENSYRLILQDVKSDDSIHVHEVKWEASYRLAMLLHDKRDFDEALKIVNSCENENIKGNFNYEKARNKCLAVWMRNCIECSAVDAKQQMEEALDELVNAVNSSPKKNTMTSELGLNFKRLAIIYWDCGGTYRERKEFCFKHLAQAAKYTPRDGELFAWLGKWYVEIAQDVIRAEKCYLKALAQSPQSEMAGIGLSSLYSGQGKTDLCVELWKDICKKNPQTQPTWVLKLLGQYYLSNNSEEALICLQYWVRNDPEDPASWAALAHSYRYFGKTISAERAYLKVVELLGHSNLSTEQYLDKYWCLICELARVEGELRLYEQAMQRLVPLLQDTLERKAENRITVAVLYATLLFEEAQVLCGSGYYGRAAMNIKSASAMLTKYIPESVFIASLDFQKLYGDIHCFAYYMEPKEFVTSGITPEDAGSGWLNFIREGREAYEKAYSAFHKSTIESASHSTMKCVLLYDIGLGYWYEAMAIATTYGHPLQPFASWNHATSLSVVQKLVEKSAMNMTLSLIQNPNFGPAWVGLGILADHITIKQFAWIRAIQCGEQEIGYANLSLLYCCIYNALPNHTNSTSLRTSSLVLSMAEQSLIQLQSQNPNQPLLWIGYGLLYQSMNTESVNLKAVEAYLCAQETGTYPDAIINLALLYIRYDRNMREQWSVESKKLHITLEFVLEGIKKAVDRNPFCSKLWNMLGVVQSHMELWNPSKISFREAISIREKEAPQSMDDIKGMKWNELLSTVALSGNGDCFKIIADQIQAIKDQVVSPIWLALIKTLQHYHQNAIDMTDILLQFKHALGTIKHGENSSVSSVVLSICLAVAAFQYNNFKSEANALAHACREQLSFLDCRENIELDFMQVMHLHNLFTLQTQSNLNIQVVHHSSSCQAETTSRIQLIDCQEYTSLMDVSSGCTCTKKYTVCPEGCLDVNNIEDKCLLDALQLLLLSRPSENTEFAKPAIQQGQKVIRMSPNSCYGYLLTGAAMIKEYIMGPQLPDSTRILSTAEVAIKLGLQLVNLQGGGSSLYEQVCLSWLLATCRHLQSKSESNETNVAAAQMICQETSNLDNSLWKQLWDCRMQNLTNQILASERYRAIINSMVSKLPEPSTAIDVMLMELAGWYEELNYNDCAFQIWKHLLSSLNTRSLAESVNENEGGPTTSSSDSSALNSGKLAANVRLTVLHLRNGNSKGAKKQLKSALTYVDSGSNAEKVIQILEQCVHG